MLDAARIGDVKSYMASYTGQMDSALKQSLAETTEAGFAKYLKDSNAAVKGIAISEPQPLTDREVKVRVEYVYQDRNEAQTMYLEKGPGRLENRPSGWRREGQDAGPLRDSGAVDAVGSLRLPAG